MVRFIYGILILVIAASLVSCSGNGGGSMVEQASGNMRRYERSNVHAVQQALPTVMVIPGDNLLKSSHCIEIKRVNGQDLVLRDYQRFLIKNNDYRALISLIQEEFVGQNYPIVDLVQALKNLSTKDAYAVADNLQQDMKTALLQTCHPDIIIELGYSNQGIDMTSHNYSSSSKIDNLTLIALDAYTSKAISSHSDIGLSGSSATSVLEKSIKKSTRSLLKDITRYFSDILQRGREVNIRFVVQNGANLRLSDNSVEGDPISDFLIDYVKRYTVKGAYNMQANTDYELSFANSRIKLLNDDGTQNGTYDWARDCIKTIKNRLGLQCSNSSQGLGDIVITIKGY